MIFGKLNFENYLKTIFIVIVAFAWTLTKNDFTLERLNVVTES